MVLEFIASLGIPNVVVMVAALAVFIYWFKSMMSLIKGAFFVGIASAVFPIAANKLFGIPIPLNIETLVSFVLLGVGLYFIYMFGRTVYRVLSIAGKSVSFFSRPLRGSGKPVVKVVKEKSVMKKFREEDE